MKYYNIQEIFAKNIGMYYYRRLFVSRKSNKEGPHVALYCYSKSRIELFYKKQFYRGQINRVQVEVFVNCLRVVLVCHIQTQEHFRRSFKSGITIQSQKKSGLKVGINDFFMSKFARTQESIFHMYSFILTSTSPFSYGN